MSNITYDIASGHVFTFNPGGTFEWTTYYPIGQLALIKQSAETLLANLSNFGIMPTNTPVPPTLTPTKATILGDYDNNGGVNLADFGYWKIKYLAVPPTMTLVEFGVWKTAYLGN